VEVAKKRIYDAIIGLILLLASILILRTINPEIINKGLNFTFPKLPTIPEIKVAGEAGEVTPSSQIDTNAKHAAEKRADDAKKKGDSKTQQEQEGLAQVLDISQSVNSAKENFDKTEGQVPFVTQISFEETYTKRLKVIQEASLPKNSNYMILLASNLRDLERKVQNKYGNDDIVVWRVRTLAEAAEKRHQEQLKRRLVP
ncbi:MAG: hypothetical protein AAB611_00485, partial [Patescibacteria group bacterium]